MASYARFVEIYTKGAEQRDQIEQDRILIGLINNSILQNKLIFDLSTAQSPGAKLSDPDSSRLVQDLSSKIQPLQEQLMKEK
jgi:hypothetical protein